MAESGLPDAGVSPEIAEFARRDLANLRREPWYREDGWSVSPYNFVPETKPPPDVPPSVKFVDISGRVIEQMPGIALAVEEKVALATALSHAGVTEMQSVLHVASKAGQQHLRAINAQGLPIRLVALVYTTRDVEIAAECGAKVAEVVTVGRPSLHASYRSFSGTTEADLVKSATERIELARKLGLDVHADINLVSYAEVSYIQKYVRAARSAGANVIQFADGSSGLGPRACGFLVRTIKAADPSTPIGVHLHNDFGLALSDAMAAFEAGATSFDVSIDGIGERAGQLDISQWAVTLKVFYGLDAGLKLSALRELSLLVQDLTRSRLPGYYPITGEFAFDTCVESVLRHEFGIDHMIHAPMAPQFVGARRSYPLGRNTGRFGLLLRAQGVSIDVPEERVAELTGALDSWFEIRKRPISDDELRDLLITNGCREVERI